MNNNFLEPNGTTTMQPTTNPLPRRQLGRRGLMIAVLLILLLCLGGGLYFYLSQVRPNHLPPLRARGEVLIEAVQKDGAGIEPTTSFTIGTVKDVDVEKMRQAISITPAVEFTIKKEPRRTADTFDLITKALAQGELQDLTYTYTLEPSKALAPDTVYALALHDKDIAREDYSFAFQVKSGFRMTETHPRDKVSQVPVNTGIEITFNRLHIKDPQKFITITPQVEGEFSIRRATVVFVPKKLDPATIYTVKVAKDLPSTDPDETLGQEYTFSFETGGQEIQPSEPYFSFGREVVDVLPTKKPALSIYSNNIADSQYKGSLYRVNSIEEFTDSYIKSRSWEYGWSYFYNRKAKFDVQPAESTKVASFSPTVITDGYQKFLELPERLSEGFYLLKIEASGMTRWAWLQVTPFDYYFSLTEQRGFVWLYDNTTRQPVSEATVSLVPKQGEKVELQKTNDQGLAEFAVPEALKSSSAVPIFLMVQKGTSVRAILAQDRWGYQSGVSGGDNYWDALRSDRYVYHLTDTIKYWGILKGRTEDIRQQKVTVALYPGYFYGFYDTWGGRTSDLSQALVKQEVVISSEDTIEGELKFEGVAPGSYQVIVLQGNTVLSQRSVEIQSFSKPAYQITVEPSKKTMFADEEVAFKVKANMFDGSPVTNMELRYNIYWNGENNGTVKLDTSGEGVVRFTPRFVQETKEGYDGYPRSLSFNISPVNGEEGEISASGNVWVFGPKLKLQVRSTDSGGDNKTITAKVNEIALGDGSSEYGYGLSEFLGRPLNNQLVKAEVVKRTYIKKETGQRYDPIYKVTYKTYSYSTRDDIVKTVSGATNSSGEWSFTQAFPTEDRVSYFVQLQTADAGGRIDYETYSIWNFNANDVDPSTVELSYEGEQLNEKAFSVGDPIRLNVKRVGTAADQPVLWYRYQNSLDGVGIIRNAELTDTFGEKYAPNVRYRAVVYGQRGFSESQEVGAVLKADDKTLDITISSDKPSYKPKETVTLTLAVKNKSHTGVAAELNVAAVDEALFHVMSEYWQENLISSLYRRIYVSPLTGWSYLDASRQGLGGAEKGGCFTGDTRVTMSDGSTKAIKDIVVGDMVASFASDQQHRIEPAVVQGVSSHTVNEYLIINKTLKVTWEHPLYINGRWTVAEAAKIGDQLLTEDGSLIAITSIEQKKAPKTPVYNMLVGTYHTYFANGYYAHNAEKGGTPRSDFVDVPLFRTVKTNSSGIATVTFQAPDNITSWRVTALAYQPTTISAGEQSKLVSVTLPFFIDVVSAPTFLTGDQPIITARLFGTSYDSKKPAEISLESPSLQVQSGQSTLSQFTRFPLGTVKAGDHDITVRAQQGSLGDAVTRPIKVVDSYFHTLTATSYNLTDPAVKIEGNQKGFTKIKFVDQGRGQYFYPLLWRTSNYGIRLDESAAGLLAGRVLESYFGETPENINLLNYQLDDGGLSQFTYSSTDPALSALVADAVPEDIGQAALAQYFQGILRNKDVDGIERLQALYGLASLKKPVLLELQAINNRSMDFDHSLYLALAFAKAGDWESARTIYRTAIRPELTFENEGAWLTSEKDESQRIKKTALVAVLAAHIHEVDDIDDLWKYISSNDPKYDMDVLEEVVVLRDLVSMSDAQPASLTYKAGAKGDTFVLKPGETKSIQLSAEELKDISFSGISGQPVAISYYDVYGKPEDIKKDKSLSLIRTYSVNNKQTNTWAEGDLVKITLQPKTNERIEGGYEVIDFLPSGLRPATNVYQRGYTGGNDPCDSVWYPMTITDTSVHFSFHYWPDNPYKCKDLRINYYARVVNPGTYRANPAILQSKENRNSITITKEDRVEIK